MPASDSRVIAHGGAPPIAAGVGLLVQSIRHARTSQESATQVSYVLPFTIWMLRSFFMEIPLEVEEAARIDGCSWWGVLTRVILPVSLSGLP